MMKITKTELIFATVNFICVKLFTAAPVCFTDIAKSAAWIAVLINTAAAILAFLLIYFLFKKGKSDDIFAFLPGWAKRIFGLVGAAYFIITAGISLSLVIRSVIRTFMPETPSFLISLIFAAAIIYASRKGIVANVKTSVIIAPLLLIIAAVFAALIPNMELNNLFPILGDNNFYFSSMFGFNFFSDFIAFYYFLPYLKNKRDAFGAGFIAILISSALCLLAVLASTLTIPYEAKFASPFYQMLTFMAGSRAVVSAIKLFKLVFLVNFFLYLSTAASLAARSLEKGFEMKYSKELLWIITLLIILTEEIQYRTLTLIEVYEILMGKTYIVFPLIPIAAYFLGRRRKENEKNNGGFNCGGDDFKPDGVL